MALASVRPAQAGDGLPIAWVQLEVWQAAFADVLPDEVLNAPAAMLAESWTAVLDSLLVAVEGEHLVGFAHCAVDAGQPDSADFTNTAVGAVLVLHVRPAWARRGHGGRLLAAAAERLRSNGAQLGEWWIPITDVATQRFARTVGWERTEDSRAFDTGRATLRERRWVGTLDLMVG